MTCGLAHSATGREALTGPTGNATARDDVRQVPPARDRAGRGRPPTRPIVVVPTAAEPLAWAPGRWQGGGLNADLPHDDEQEGSLPELPPREPRPWYVHWAACTLSCFLVLLPFFFRNLGLGLLIAGVLGAIAMRFTQRIEERHLAEREERERGG